MKELLSKCRYYAGESACPYNDSQLRWYWEMERAFVKSGGTFIGESVLYKGIGGKSFPGIPSALLMVMFTSWAKAVWDKKAALPEFYRLVDDYIDVASDHFSKNKIPR